MGKQKRFRAYYSVGEPGTPASTPWHIWIDATSVYLLNFALLGLKVSLHGTDPRHPIGGRFHVRPDGMRNEAPKQPSADVAFRGPAAGWPCVFAGQATDVGALAVRIRVTPEACALGKPHAKAPQRNSSANVALPTPKTGWFADLDLTFQQLPAGFVAVEDYPQTFSCSWGDTRFVAGMRVSPQRDRGGYIELSPVMTASSGESGFRLEHATGIVLRASTRLRRRDLYPTPVALLGPVEDPSQTGKPHRSLRMDVVDDVLWVVEDVVGTPDWSTG